MEALYACENNYFLRNELTNLSETRTNFPQERHADKERDRGKAIELELEFLKRNKINKRIYHLTLNAGNTTKISKRFKIFFLFLQRNFREIRANCL